MIPWGNVEQKNGKDEIKKLLSDADSVFPILYLLEKNINNTIEVLLLSEIEPKLTAILIKATLSKQFAYLKKFGFFSDQEIMHGIYEAMKIVEDEMEEENGTT